MTIALLQRHAETGTDNDRLAVLPHLVVVLVSPAGGLGSCGTVISELSASGAVVYAEEVDSIAARLDLDCAALSDVVWTISNTLERANADFPGLPVVLVGHASTAAGALAFTELYPGQCTGLVLTERTAA
jgi:hypothetical protein